MKLTTGYDKPLAEQFFRRSVTELISHVDDARLIIPEEVDYLTARFGETAAIPVSNTLAFPAFRGSILELLVLLSDDCNNRRYSQLAELTANLLLFKEGLGAFGAICEVENGHSWRLHRIVDLYRNAAFARFRKDGESFVLRQLARNAKPWITLLGRIPGKDFLEMIVARQSFLVLPND